MADPIASLTTALADRYRIERELGAGGMATVYLAEDLKHTRKVAIKVLRPELAAVLGADRFIQEIATTAQLQHPNILPLFDSGRAVVLPLHGVERGTGGEEAFLYYVMPYVEGETLRDKLNRETQLSIEEAVKISTEVADALQYAHVHGVVHRDIKPENILLHAGRPMVADFGIALAVSAAAGGRMTETGLSLGTPHYMSPEQATAEKDITNRSDIYSLGSVLYEMLAGEPPHTGTSAQQIIMKIVTEEATPVTKIRKAVASNVAAAVAKALEKLPADRFPSAEAFGSALVDPSFRYGGAAEAARATEQVGTRWKAAAAISTAAALVLAGVMLLGRTHTTAVPVMHFDVTVPPNLSLVIKQGVNFDISSDGAKIVFVAQDSAGRQSLWLRAVDRIDPARLTGTDGARNPRFSPDDEAVAYISGDSLNTVSLAGAPALAIVQDSVRGGSGPGGLAWGHDGYLYFTKAGGGIWRAPPVGGSAERVMRGDSLEYDAWFDALPNGKGLLFSIGNPTDARLTKVAILDLDSHERKVLLQGTMARFSPPEDLLYATAQGQLLTAPFDVDRLEVKGARHPILDGIQINSGSASYFATSASGALLYATGSPEVRSTPVWLSADGSTVAIPVGETDEGAVLSSPRISPDGRRVAFQRMEQNIGPLTGDIWIYDIAQQTFSPLTLSGGASEPFWSPDGTEVGYRSADTTGARTYDARLVSGGITFEARRADFSGQVRQLIPASAGAVTAAWAPDGRGLLYADTAGRIIYTPLGDRRAPTEVTGPVLDVARTGYPPFYEFSVSPDGRWVAFTSDVSGSEEVYVTPVSGKGGRRQVSVAGGLDPVWARNGTGIIYYGLNDAWMIAAVHTEPEFAVASRERFVRAIDFFYRGYDVARDGRILAFHQGSGGPMAANRIRFISDWRDLGNER